VRLVANPVALRALIVLIVSAFSFLMGLIAIRSMRRNIAEEMDLTQDAPSLDALPMHLYNTVIQQLKQQKTELMAQSQAEQRRARMNESLSQALLANLSSGVLVFGANGLVKSSNPAAKAILGFGSVTGLSIEDIFRGALVRSEAGATFSDRDGGAAVDEPDAVAEQVHIVLREDSKKRQFEAEYETPAGEQRIVSITVSAVPAQDGGLLGVACLVSDLSELEGIRQQQQLQGDISAEMALKLRTSLSTISSFAQQLANTKDASLAAQLAQDIAQEAVQLDRSIGGFLTSRQRGALAATGLGSNS
jgi:PAS domain-containing protein